MATLIELQQIYGGKRVLVTGHTGFKGTWMSRLLLSLGADVYGIGLDEGIDKIFELSNSKADMQSYIQDIRDQKATSTLIEKINPHLVFHLAAQPLVIESYKNPIDTFASNVMGTAHVLEGCRRASALEGAIMITTDKVYHNHEWAYPYRETDGLGGHDPYSASKAACELVIASYRHSFFEGSRLCSLRAGNVIGGGDFADNRIIPDLVRSIQSGKELVLRSPHSVRPWQHVLDALWAYILAGHCLAKNGSIPSPSYNVAPPDNSDKYTVLYVVESLIRTLGRGSCRIDESTGTFKEMGRLRLDPSLIGEELNWKAGFTTDEALTQTALEYDNWMKNPSILKKQLDDSISLYLKKQG